MELCTITSPINGVVATPFLKERIGEVIRQGDLLCRLMDHRALIADIAVPEREIGDIQVGYPVGIKMEGYPSRRFEGYVSSIAPVASVEEGKPVVRVRCELANPDGLLKSEMTGNAGIYCPPRPIGAIMIRRLVRFIRTEFWW
jgi:hypothetical protein